MRSDPRFLALVGLMLISFAGTIVLLDGSGPVDRASKAVVVVVCGEGYGTGWWINSKTVVTAAHVVSCPRPVLVRGYWESPAIIHHINRSLDVAVLVPEIPPPFDPSPLEVADRAWVSESVYVVGYPIQVYQELSDLKEMSVAPRAARGEVAWINPETWTIEITAPTDQGNSGGPIIDADTGAVVGIVSYARMGTVDRPVYGVSLAGLRLVLDQAGVRYGVHHWWETRIVIAIIVAIITPLVWWLVGGSLWRQ